MKGDLKDKTVFIDFYMKNCYYCYLFRDEYNEVEEVMQERYEGEIAFLKVDGPVVKQLSSLYHIQSYPSYIAIKEGTNGQNFEKFTGSRTKAGLSSWIDKLMYIEEEDIIEREEAAATRPSN